MRVVSIVVVLLLYGLVPSVMASASEECPPGTTPQPGDTGIICIPADDPGDPGGTIPGEPTPGGGGGQPACMFMGQKIPCQTPQGTWFSSQQCYAQLLSPQPLSGDPRWEGHDPTDGSVWQCVRPGVTFVWLYFFVPRGETPDLVDPGELGREALDTMRLAVPRLHMAPGPPASTYVNTETWLWIGQDQWGPLRKTVTAGGTTVAVTATPFRVWWDMGDGSELTCDSPGRPWAVGMSDRESTDCAHVYESTSRWEARGAFRLRSAIYYRAEWTCSGACSRPAGDLGVVAGANGLSELVVRERQSLVVGGDAS